MGTIGHERIDRMMIAANAKGSPGFDRVWLLNHVGGEIVVPRRSKTGQQARSSNSASAGDGTRVAVLAVSSH